MTTHQHIERRRGRIPRRGAVTVRSRLVVDTHAEREGVTVMVAVGEVDLVTVGLLDHGLTRSEDTVVDLSRVGFFAVAGVHTLLRAARRAHGARRGFAVVAAAGPVTRVLRLSGADAGLAVFPTVDAAIQAMDKDQEEPPG